MSGAQGDNRDTLMCVRCGYDLRAAPRDTRCPECGTPVPLSEDPPALRPLAGEEVPPAGAVCPRCGRGLGDHTPPDPCSACGAPPWLWVYGGYLAAARPKVVRQLRLGAACWMGHWVGLLALNLVTFIVPLVASAVGNQAWLDEAAMLSRLTGTGLAVLTIPAGWLLSAPWGTPSRLALFVRATTIVYGVLLLLRIGELFLWQPADVLGLLAAHAWDAQAAVEILLLLRLVPLIRGIPAPRLVPAARGLLALYAGIVLLDFAFDTFGAPDMRASRATNTPSSVAYAALFFAYLLALFVAWVWFTILLAGLWRRLRRVESAAATVK